MLLPKVGVRVFSHLLHEEQEMFLLFSLHFFLLYPVILK
jgi:hypothetical protein